nr:hypothetical protein [Tanacetum cinerariifolium]
MVLVEFCLVIGLRFGVEYWADCDNDEDPIPFRRRVFSSSLDGEHITGKIAETLINSKLFDRLHDDYAVSLCCVGLLQLVLLGVEGRRSVLDLMTWILEYFRVMATTYYNRHSRYPRATAWSKKGGFLRSMGNLHVARLTPDDIEARSDWWISSRAYFDGVIDQAERVPQFLNQQNLFEVPSDFYREFEGQKRDFEQQKRDFEEMRKKDAEREKCMNKCVNLWRDTVGFEFGQNRKNQHFGPWVDNGKFHEILH